MMNGIVWAGVTHLNFLAINTDCFHWEIDSNCVAMALDIISRFESLHDTRFARATISDQNYFE